MQRIHFQQWRIASQREAASVVVVVVVGTFASKIKTWHRGKNVNQRNFTILRGYHYSSDFIESHKCWTHFRPNFFCAFPIVTTPRAFMQLQLHWRSNTSASTRKLLFAFFSSCEKKSEPFEKFTGNSWSFKRSENEWILMNVKSEAKGSKKNKPEKTLLFRVISSLVCVFINR